MLLDPRIGNLNNGQFYVFAEGYSNPVFTGTLDEVEARLGVGSRSTATVGVSVELDTQSAQFKSWRVHMTLQHPAWDEIEGFWYTVLATNKARAKVSARKLARDDGHLHSRTGKVTFNAYMAD